MQKERRKLYGKNVPNNYYIIIRGGKEEIIIIKKNRIYVYDCIARNTYKFDIRALPRLFNIMEERVLRIRECCAHASCLNVVSKKRKRKRISVQTREKEKGKKKKYLW